MPSHERDRPGSFDLEAVSGSFIEREACGRDVSDISDIAFVLSDGG